MNELKTTLKNRIQPNSPIWLDTIILLICIGISYTGPVSFPWKVPLIATLILSYIYAYNQNLLSLGLKKTNVNETILWGFSLAFIVVIGISNFLNPLIEYILQKEVDTSAYGALEGDFTFLTNYWWKAMLSAAIAEEIFYRGFCFYFMERLLGFGTWQKVLIVALTSIYFGLSHSFQGPTGVIGIMAASVAFGTIFYMSKRNLWAVILGHALIDTWSLFSLYKGGISLFF